jgi:caffeoyl-CoA O-methyltransferase
MALANRAQTGEFLHMKDFAASQDPRIGRYLEESFRPQDPALLEIIERTRAHGFPEIHVGPMDGLHLEVLARASGARKIVEIGTLVGYSGVCLVRALPADGRLYTFEMEPDHAKQAEETFRKSGFSDRVQLRVGTALDRLREIEPHAPFDLVFVDADKVSYPAYLEWAARFLRVGGLLVADNTLAWGMIADTDPPAEEAESVRGLQEFNRLLTRDPRFRATLLPTGEGLTLAVKIRP